MAASEDDQPDLYDAGVWSDVEKWLAGKVEPDARPLRYARAYRDVLARGDEPTPRQLDQAAAVLATAMAAGYQGRSVQPDPIDGVPESVEQEVLRTELPADPIERQWDELLASLEAVLADLPVPSWFGLWLASDRGVPHNDGRSYMAEVRLTDDVIVLRCLGVQHLSMDAQPPASAIADMAEQGWQEHRDARRLMRLPDLPLTDKGRHIAAEQLVRLLREVYGAEVPDDLYVEVDQEFQSIALGLFGGLKVLAPDHFAVDRTQAEDEDVDTSVVTRTGVPEVTDDRPASGSAPSAGVVRDRLTDWCGRAGVGSASVTTSPGATFALRIVGARPSPRGGVDPVTFEVGDSGVVMGLSWPAMDSRMSPPPLPTIRRSVENRNAVLDRDRFLGYRFRRDTAYAGSVFRGISMFTVIPASEVTAEVLDERLLLLAQAADVLDEDDLWEMGVWRSAGL